MNVYIKWGLRPYVKSGQVLPWRICGSRACFEKRMPEEGVITEPGQLYSLKVWWELDQEHRSSVLLNSNACYPHPRTHPTGVDVALPGFSGTQSAVLELEEAAGAANPCPTSTGCLENWRNGAGSVVPELRPSPHRFLQEEVEKPEGLMVVFHHQLEKHHHMVEAPLVLYGRGGQWGGPGWEEQSLGLGREGIPGRNWGEGAERKLSTIAHLPGCCTRNSGAGSFPTSSCR